MATFFWNNGPTSGSLITMELTIVGEVRDLIVTGRGSLPTMPVAIPVTFQQCIQFQTVQCGPVPLSVLPLSATGTDCSNGSLVLSGASASPADVGGPLPFCDALTAGGIFFTTQGGGGGGPQTTPRDLCDAAQQSPLLDNARMLFTAACGALRADQANAAVYTGIAATAATIAGGFAAAAVAVGVPWAALALAICASVFGTIAIIFSVLAGKAAANISQDEQQMDVAQTLWRNAIASVRRACCPAWIVIQTGDLACP